MVLKTSDSEEELTCVGTFPDITQGVTIEAEGQFSQHHIYGRQFNIQSYAEKAPEDTQAMERYLRTRLTATWWATCPSTGAKS